MGSHALRLHRRDGAAGDDCFPFREDRGSLVGRRRPAGRPAGSGARPDGLKDRGGCYGSAGSGKTKERKEDLMSSTVWFFVGVLTGSLVATAAILLTVGWLLRRKR